MTAKDIIDLIAKDGSSWVVILILMMSFIEISPIKVNPWKNILQVIRHFITKETDARITSNEKRIDGIEKNIEDFKDMVVDYKDKHLLEEVESARLAIINAARDFKKCDSVDAIDVEYLSQINKKCDWYEDVCEKNHISNGVAQMSIEYIREKYRDAILDGGS